MYEDERKEIIEYGLHQGKVMLVSVSYTHLRQSRLSSPRLPKSR